MRRDAVRAACLAALATVVAACGGGGDRYGRGAVESAFRAQNEPLEVFFDTQAELEDPGTFAIGELPEVALMPAEGASFEYNVLIYADEDAAKRAESGPGQSIFGGRQRFIRARNVVVMYRPETPHLERVRAALERLDG